MKSQQRTRESILVQRRTELRRRARRIAQLRQLLKDVTTVKDFLVAVDKFGPMTVDERHLAGSIYLSNRRRAAERAEKIQQLKEGIEVLNGKN